MGCSDSSVVKERDYDRCQTLINSRHEESKHKSQIKLNALYESGNLNYLRQEKWAGTLTHLDLQSNNLTSQSISTLMKGKFPCLKVLKLGFNSIDDNGVGCLSKNETLLQLYLHHNQITDEGVKQLSNGELKKLSKLALDYNKIGNESFTYLIKFKFLQELTLAGNEIDQEGMRIFQELKFRQLIVLDLSYNPLKEEGRERANEMSRMNGINIMYSMM